MCWTLRLYQWRRISDDSEENYNIHTTLRYKYILIGTSHEALVMNKKERMDVDLKKLQIYEDRKCKKERKNSAYKSEQRI